MRPVWSSHRRACAYFLWNNITAHNTRNDLATDNHESSLPNSMSVAVPRLNCERRHGATGHLDCNEIQRKIIVEEEIKEARLTTSLSDSHIEVVNLCPPPFWLCLLQLFVTPLVNTTNFCSICVRHTSASISELLNLLSLHFTFQPVARQNLSLTFHGGICHRNNLTGLTFANVGPYRFPNRSERKITPQRIIIWDNPLSRGWPTFFGNWELLQPDFDRRWGRNAHICPDIQYVCTLYLCCCSFYNFYFCVVYEKWPRHFFVLSMWVRIFVSTLVFLFLCSKQT